MMRGQSNFVRVASPFAGMRQTGRLRKAAVRSMLRASLKQQRPGLTARKCWRTTAAVRFFYVRTPLRALTINGRALVGRASVLPVPTFRSVNPTMCPLTPFDSGMRAFNQTLEAASCASSRTPIQGKTPHSFSPLFVPPCAPPQPQTRINPRSMPPARRLSLSRLSSVRR